MAAQNCRKRKIDQIAMLERQVETTRRRKRELMEERDELHRQRIEWHSRLAELQVQITSIDPGAHINRLLQTLPSSEHFSGEFLGASKFSRN